MNVLVLCTAVLFWAPALVADLTALPAADHTVQTQANVVPTVAADTAVAPVAPAAGPACPCVCQPNNFGPAYPVRNVAPWSWQHDNQNDDQWPADHGG